MHAYYASRLDGCRREEVNYNILKYKVTVFIMSRLDGSSWTLQKREAHPAGLRAFNDAAIYRCVGRFEETMQKNDVTIPG